MNCIILSPVEKSRKAIERTVAKNKSLKILASVAHPDQAKSVFLTSQKIDILFINIEKAGLNGWHALETVPRMRPFKIFLSTKKALAKEAFDNNGIDFIHLPLTDMLLIKALSKITNAQPGISAAHLNANFIFIKSNGTFCKVAYKDIIYIEAMADYISIYTTEKRYIVHSTMKGILNKLPADSFFRVHKSFIVAFNRIIQINQKTIELKERNIPLSKNYRSGFLAKVNTIG